MSSAIYLSRHPAKIFELGQDSSHRCRVCFGVPHDIHATHFSESEGKFVPGPEQGSCLGDLSAQELFGFSITVFSTHHSREMQSLFERQPLIPQAFVELQYFPFEFNCLFVSLEH